MAATTCPTALRPSPIPTAQNLFTLGLGAIYPTGSWEIALFNDQADFEMGTFPPPLPEGATPATSATTPTSPWA